MRALSAILTGLVVLGCSAISTEDPLVADPDASRALFADAGAPRDASQAQPDSAGCLRDTDCAELGSDCRVGACDPATHLCVVRAAHPEASCGGGIVCGEFGECEFPPTCANTGVRRRECTPHVCKDVECVAGNPYTEEDSSACVHNTDGVWCAEAPACDTNYGECTFASTCSMAGSRTRSCYPPVCQSGLCGSGAPYSETDPDPASCQRKTEGTPCGDPSCDEYVCDFAHECSNSGTRARVCRPQVCDSAGSCGLGTAYSETDPNGCWRLMDGQPCVALCLLGRFEFGNAPGTCSQESCVKNEGATCS